VKTRILASLYAPVRNRLQGISAQLDRNAVLLGQLMARTSLAKDSIFERLTDAEFKVFSQFGEDGIVQYLIFKVPIEKRIFVEVGVGDYGESNTRFLLVGNKWSGLVIEGDEACTDEIKRSSLYRRYALRVVSAFITKENINQIIRDAGIEGDIGVLSIDIDGNDYWVWQAINVIQPRIVICEFNRRFGCNRAVSIVYKSDFQVGRAHPSRLYHGASLPALCFAAEEKGYDFVGCTSEGVNAFFVRKDIHTDLKKLSAQEGFGLIGVGGEFGVTAPGGLEVIEHMEVYDVKTDRLLSLQDLRSAADSPGEFLSDFSD
jgi:hypothetical protein